VRCFLLVIFMFFLGTFKILQVNYVFMLEVYAEDLTAEVIACRGVSLYIGRMNCYFYIWKNLSNKELRCCYGIC
jgi:hypothetical protein